METFFNDKYNRLIRTYKRKMIMKGFPSKHLENKLQRNKCESDERYSGFSKLEYQARIFGQVVFWNFLVFYDEFSYAINERIKEVYETTFQNIENELKTFKKFKKMLTESNMNDIIFEKVKYRNLHYFRNKLEEKLANIFNIDINEIRRILYGCHPKDDNIQAIYIQIYYDIILDYKRHCHTKNIKIYDFLEDLHDVYGRKLTKQKEAIKISMSKYAHCFNHRLPHLYKYHKVCSRIFTISKTRFYTYEKVLKKYGRGRKFPPTFIKEDRFFFARPQLYQGNDLELVLRDQNYEHVSYSDETKNIYFDMFQKMQSFVSLR